MGKRATKKPCAAAKKAKRLGATDVGEMPNGNVALRICGMPGKAPL